MGITPDRSPGPSIEEELQLEDNGLNPSVVGGITINAGAIKARDSVGIFDIRSGAGLSEAGHKALRQLIHFIDEGPTDGFATGSFKQTTGTIFPTFEAWYVAGATPPAGLIVSLATTWVGILKTQEVWKMYAADGITILVTVTDTISQISIFEISRTRAIV